MGIKGVIISMARHGSDSTHFKAGHCAQAKSKEQRAKSESLSRWRLRSVTGPLPRLCPKFLFRRKSDLRVSGRQQVAHRVLAVAPPLAEPLLQVFARGRRKF
jgi:hypothetical protein